MPKKRIGAQPAHNYPIFVRFSETGAEENANNSIKNNVNELCQ